MPGLSRELYQRCRETLLKCSEFGSDASLQSVFVTDELYPFRDRVPTAAAKSERVDMCLDFLLRQSFSSGQPLPPVFLAALRDRYHEGNALRDELDALIEPARTALAPKAPPTEQSSPPPPSRCTPDASSIEEKDDTTKPQPSTLSELVGLIETPDARPTRKQVLRLLRQQAKHLGIGMLPQNIATLMAAIGQVYSPETAVDINCGLGQVLDQCRYAQTRVGIDRDARLIRLASYLYPGIKFLAGDILDCDITRDFDLSPSERVGSAPLQLSLDRALAHSETVSFGLVITALPFGVRVKHCARHESLEQLLLDKALQLMDDGGVVVALSPPSILTAQGYETLRKEVLDHYALDMIVSLRSGALAYTSIPSCILVIRNGKPNNTVYLAEYQGSTSEIVDNLRLGTGSFQIPLSRVHDRWDRHFFDPRYDEIDAILQGTNARRLADISEVIHGHVFRPEEHHETGDYLILTPRHFRHGRIEVDRTVRRGQYAKASADRHFRRCIVQEGDVLVGLVHDPAVYVYRAGDSPAVAGANVAIIRSCDSEYIGAYLRTTAGVNLFLSQVDRKAAGVTVRRLTIQALREIKIPILPLTDLSSVSDEAISTSSLEGLEALSGELVPFREHLAQLGILQTDASVPPFHTLREGRTLYQVQTPQVLSQSSLSMLQAFFTFLNERLNRIETAIEALQATANQILSLVQSTQREIRQIKEIPRDEEEKLLRIYSKLDGIADWMEGNRSTMQDYARVVECWLERCEILERASLQLLSSAEFLFDEIHHVEDSDYSPFVIQYCRALENEILVKLFKAYHADFHSRIGDPVQFLGNDLGDEKASEFAKMLRRDEKTYTLGQMCWVLQLIRPGGRTLERSRVLHDFHDFASQRFHPRVLDKEYLELIQTIQTDYRNKSAHPNILGVDIACECRITVRRALNEFLAGYRLSS